MTDSDIAFIESGLSKPRDLERFHGALTAIERYEAAGLLLKSEHEGIKFAINHALEEAWKTLVREPFMHGRGATFTDAENKLVDSVYWPSSHLVEGYLKKVQATKVTGPMRDAMLKFFTEAAPIGARVKALKEKIGKRAPAPTKTSIARDERSLLAMTCQCCGRDVLAETGEIAHHGYERPGQGWQTSSCFGARTLPFEVSRDRLGELIVRLRDEVAQNRVTLAKIEAEEVQLAWTYQDHTQLDSYRRAKDVMVMVTRETFPAIFEATAEVRKYKSLTTFDSIKASKISRLQGQIKATDAHIAMQQARFDGWVQTHLASYVTIGLAGTVVEMGRDSKFAGWIKLRSEGEI